MADFVPRILSRREVFTTPWIRVVEKEVVLGTAGQAEKFYSIAQPDYVTAIAVTPDGRVPLVRQYRPAIEQYTWELPAGTVDAGETAEFACRRELREEAGMETLSIVPLGNFYPDTGRLTNQAHVFFMRASAQVPDFTPEPGMTVDFVTPAELEKMIARGEIKHQLHLAAILVAKLSGLFS